MCFIYYSEGWRKFFEDKKDNGMQNSIHKKREKHISALLLYFCIFLVFKNKKAVVAD